uniref:Secreted protein n=1 Tax=Achlya hypogyna TaxID=1202772 RepID=A0A0A7CMC7_ACHHY|nr:secreted protein [Achlya hypogyna]
MLAALACVAYTVLTTLTSVGRVFNDPCERLDQQNQRLAQYQQQMGDYMSRSEFYRDIHPPPRDPTNDDLLMDNPRYLRGI